MTIYYVSTTGINTNPGTLTRPWKTLAYAESQLVSGDTVYVREGIYQEYFTINVPNVTFKNYNNEKPVIDGSLRENAIGVYHNMVYIVRADNVTIDGFKFQNSAGTGIYIDHSKYVTIKNCEIAHSERQSLVIIYASDNVLIEDCDIHHGAKQVFLYWNGNSRKCRDLGWGDPPNVVSKYSDNLVVRRTKIHDSYNEGFNLDVGMTNALIEYCEIYGNYKVQLYLCSSTGHTIRHNLIYGTDFSAVSPTSGGSGIEINHESSWLMEMGNPLITNDQIYGNLIANLNNGIRIGGTIDRSSQNVSVYNNTLVHNKQYGISIAIGVGQNSVFKNNIILNPLGQIANVPSGIAFDYNLWSRTPNIDAQGPNDPPYAEPKLMKTIGWNNLVGGELIPEDFILQPDSPAIDTGTYIENMTYDFFGTSIPQGSAPDIGAIEYTDVYDPCENVTCPYICIGVDLYSQKCVDGNCVTDQLVESNSLTCGYDPCQEVVCENVCIGTDLWSQKCDISTGNCIDDQLLEKDSLTCGFDPCENVVCENVCIGTDLYSQKCDPNTGNCITDQLVEANSLTCGYDPCEDITCPNICMGTDFWSQKCVAGECILDQLLQSNSPICSETATCPNICIGTDLYSQKRDPTADNCVLDQLIENNSISCSVPTDDDTITKYLVLGGLGLIGYMMLMKDKK